MSQTPPPPPPQPPAAPPPPPAGPPPGGASSAPFSVGDAVGYGWNVYWKNVGPMLLIVLVIFAVSVAFNLVGASFNQGAQTLVSLLGWLVSVLLALGLIRATLALTRGEEPKVSMLFETTHFGPYLVAAIMFTIGTFVGFVACIIPGIIFVTFFGFYGYVIVDQNEASPIEALRRSAQLVSGHFWPVLGLAIVLVLINIVGVLLCLIGLLFTAGITAIAWAYAYRALSGESVAPIA